VSVALRPEGGDLVVRGRTHAGSWEQRVRVAPSAEGSGSPTVTSLFGRELVEDLEMRLAAGGDARDLDGDLERTGIDFQISTRLTSWVAVSQEQTVDPGDPLRRERMPQELPYGLSAEGVGLRPVSAPMPASRSMSAGVPLPPFVGGPARRAMAPGMAGGERAKKEEEMWGGSSNAPRAEAPLERMRAPQDEEPGARSRSAPRPAAPMPPPMAAPPPPQGMGAPPPSPPATAGKAMAPPPAAPSRGFLGTLKDFFSGGGADDDDRALREEASEATPFAADQPRSPDRVLRGRVALQANRVLVIEIAVDGGPITWSPAGEATVTLADGRTLTLTVVAARSTRAGTVVANGASARLTLALPDDAPLDVLEIVIAVGGDRVLIQLR